MVTSCAAMKSKVRASRYGSKSEPVSPQPAMNWPLGFDRRPKVHQYSTKPLTASQSSSRFRQFPMALPAVVADSIWDNHWLPWLLLLIALLVFLKAMKNIETRAGIAPAAVLAKKKTMDSRHGFFKK